MAKKGNTKQILSVTIDKSILEKFRRICADNSINKSQLVESLIKKYIGAK